MAYVVAGVLLLAAVALLTLPWSRRDPADFTPAELGYVWRGPRGAVIGALRGLADADALRPSRLRGVVRTGEPLPPDTDPLARAVYGAVDVRRGPSAVREHSTVRKALPAVADRVRAAGLRVGPVRRLAGSCAAPAAPVIVLVEHRGVTGIVAGVTAILVAAWLMVLRGTTIAGARTLAAAAQDDTSALRGSGRRRQGLGWAIVSSSAAGFPIGTGSPEGSFGGGGFGAGGESGGGESSGY